MQEFLATLLGFPTVVFSLAMLPVLGYWFLVMVGALDLHAGELHFHVDGAGEGAEAALEGGGEPGHGQDLSADGATGLLSALRLRSAPLTVTLSVLVLLGWFGCYFGSRYLGPLIPGPRWLSGSVVLLLALVAATPLTALLTRPLARLFVTHHATQSASLVGQVCVIQTGHVDEKFGQAELDTGGASLLLRVRSDARVRLKRGDRALIISYDERAESFEVEPLEPLLAEKPRDSS